MRRYVKRPQLWQRAAALLLLLLAGVLIYRMAVELGNAVEPSGVDESLVDAQ